MYFFQLWAIWLPLIGRKCWLFSTHVAERCELYMFTSVRGIIYMYTLAAQSIMTKLYFLTRVVTREFYTKFISWRKNMHR
jgi:hypothetical protein